MKLAIFGGTFDPIHDAHLEVARAASLHFHLDRVLFVPAASPPHKSAGARAPYEDRVRMAEIACACDPRFEVSRLEEGTVRSYSIDTIERVRARQPEGELYFLIGADAFAEIRTWHRWRDVASAVTFLVVSRPGKMYEAPEEVRLERLDSLELPVSSSEIREALAAGEQPAGVPAGVLAYIYSRGLYGAHVAA
ncbi:MAG TPA: nicotinate-nucleotide adenylyltransferase [Candidatus Limnocylindrales bacterium]|nr:nicotinate-nucleotide adenylyltransferase [Candidatus Limnocylindrales bacterium]